MFDKAKISDTASHNLDLTSCHMKNCPPVIQKNKNGSLLSGSAHSNSNNNNINNGSTKGNDTRSIYVTGSATG